MGWHYPPLVVFAWSIVNIRIEAMMVVHLIMVAGGLFTIGIGLWAGHHQTGLLEKIGAVLAPLGLIMTVLGILLLCVPDFFFTG
jgi:hypothetical protein